MESLTREPLLDNLLKLTMLVDRLANLKSPVWEIFDRVKIQPTGLLPLQCIVPSDTL